MSRSSYLHSHEYPPSMSPDGFFHLPISVLNETAPFPMPAAAHAAAFHVAPNAYSQEYYSHPIAAQVSGPPASLFVVDEAGGQQCGPRVHLPEAPVTIQISPACQAPEDPKDEKAPPAPVDQEQLAALISARERDVKNLLATLAMPLASWDAKFLWHCTMNQTRNTEPEFMLKMKEIHKTFYVPPPIAFYALWLHRRFWTGSTELMKDVEARLPESFGVGMSKDARIGIFLYMLALLFSNKHLDDFSYRNSSWYEAAGVPASMFFQFEIIALRELGWNFKIPTEEWLEWIEYLQTSNSYLEHAHPTHGVYHRSVGDALRDACTAIYQMGAISSNSSSSSIDSPPAMMASPVPGFDEDVNGLYGYHQLLAQPAPAKYIPWDTSLDPVVHLESSRRRGSFSSLSSTSSYGLSGRSDWNGTSSPEDNGYGHAVWGDPSVEVVGGSGGPDYGGSYEGSHKRRSGNCGDDAFSKGRFEGHGLVANKYLGHASHRSESHVGAMKRPPLRTRTSSSPLKSYNRGPVDSWYSAVPNGIPAYL